MKRIFPILLILIASCSLFDDGREAGMELMPMTVTTRVYSVIDNGSGTYADVDSVIDHLRTTDLDYDSVEVNVVRRTAYNASGEEEWSLDVYWRNDSTGFYNYLNGLTLEPITYMEYPVSKGKSWGKRYGYYLFSLYDSVFVQVKGIDNLEGFGECWVVEKHFISKYYDTYPHYLVKSWYAPDIGMVKEITEFDGRGMTVNLERYE